MIVGSTLFKLDGNAYYSPEFPRGGLAATFVVDVTQVTGSPTLNISVEHRNSEDTSFSSLGSFSGIGSTGTWNADLTGCKEIVRFKYAFDVGDQPEDAAHFLMQPPTWRPY